MTTIEEISPDHFPLVATWLSEPRINRWLSAEWRCRLVTSTTVAMAVRNRRNRLYLVRYKNKACGLTALADIDTADSTAMVWYFLGVQALSGKGIMVEAVRQLVRKAFTEFTLHSIYAWVMEDNAASIRLLEKVGFRQAGRIRGATVSADHRVDRIYFDLLAYDCAQTQ